MAIDMREARLKKGLTLKQLADKVNVSESFCSLIETGERRPSVETAKKLAKVLKFKWTKFFEE